MIQLELNNVYTRTKQEAAIWETLAETFDSLQFLQR